MSVKMRSELYIWFIICTCIVSAAGSAADPPTKVVVDKSGHGRFTSVQAAIDSVPTNNDRWVYIYIKAGIYTEQVTIPQTKPYILLRGEGMTKTQIVGNGHIDITNPTFRSASQHLVAMYIGFVNSYNYPSNGNKNPTQPAVAAMIEGDKSAFYGCGFYGLQDTLWDVQGRHYYKGCTIVGAVDFIFGEATSIFEQCVVSVAPLPPGYMGYIAAQRRMSTTEKSGFVFKNCNVSGGPAFLGRAWGPFAVIVFYQSTLSNAIPPLGWYSWRYPNYETQMTFVEWNCKGQGASLAGRIPWEKKLSPQAAAQYASLDFIEAHTWLYTQPKP